MADSGQTMMSVPRCGDVSLRYRSIVRSRSPGTHFIDCGTAPCTSATVTSLPVGCVHCTRSSRSTARPQQQDRHGRHDARRAAPDQQRDQRACRDRGGQARGIDSAERRVPGERRVELAVAEREPREPAQEPAAQPFRQHPSRGQQDHPAQRAGAATPASHGISEQRGVAAHDRDEPQHQEQRDPDRRLPDQVDAVVQPVRAGEERAGREEEATPRGRTRTRALPEQEQHRRAQERQHDHARRARTRARARGPRETPPIGPSAWR